MRGYMGGLVLPSGRRVHVTAPPRSLSPIAEDEWRGRCTFGGRLLVAVDEAALQVEVEGAPLGSDALLDWPLRDFHALRDVAERLQVIAQEPGDYDCRNCGATMRADASAASLEDLEIWYAEDGAPPVPPFPLPAAVSLPSGARAETVDMAAVTGRQALSLWRSIRAGEEGGLSARVVQGLGVRALGDERNAVMVARALRDAPDPAWDVVGAAFVALNYADRAFVPHVCGACGTVHDLPAPSTREMEPPRAAFRALHGPGEQEGGPPSESFPDEATFAAMVERIGEEVYAARGVRNIALHTDPTVPPVDGSGEPLLGSYQPLYESDAVGYTDVSFEIRLYYRSFRNMWTQDGPYDVEAEVRETIDHEVEHHLHHLAGHDPMDEAEREEARRELERTFGKRAVRRAERAALMAELRRIGLLFAVLAVVFGVMVGALHVLGILQD
jgi:hypothetical protein